MANFEIDELILTYNSPDNYSVNGTSNSTSADPPQISTGNFTPNDIDFNTYLLDNAKKTIFQCNSVDFSLCSNIPGLMMNLNFRDTQTAGSLELRNGGIAIKDNNYPPPRPRATPFFIMAKTLTTLPPPSAHQLFTNQFYIFKLSLSRISPPDGFKICIDLKYSNSNTKYTANNIEFTHDNHNNIDVIVLNVTGTRDNAVHSDELISYCTSQTSPVFLSKYHDRGISIVIKNNTDIFDANIDCKKALLYLE